MSHYSQLSLKERQRLVVYIEMGLSKAEIAKKLDRYWSTIYGELNRNSEQAHYSVGIAQHQIQKKCASKRIGKIASNGVLRHYIISGLEKGWSLEQIAGRMHHQGLRFYACHETIYQFIYRSGDKSLFRLLAYKHIKRQRRYSRKKQACRYGAIRLIDARSEAIDSRKRFGHWEGDTIEFKGEKSQCVTTLVERNSRMVMLIKNASKHAKLVMKSIGEKFLSLPRKMCQTMTFDQGVEFAAYPLLEKQTHCRVYYCHAHSPWEKGSNENMNGRLRW
ncbi:MAG: IS30 family transposase, partial [Pseudomonadota bacterium]